MREVVLYHNPRCSKSRAALELLRERGVPVRLRDYLAAPPTRGELEELAAKLGLPPARWIRTREAAFAEAGLGAQSSDAELLEAIADHPILLERPIAVVGERARVGRPPELILELLEET